METTFTLALGIEVPLICGAMYPCSNPELVAAVSEAGGIGIVQPLSPTYVHGHEFREGLRYIRRLTGKPIGVNFSNRGSVSRVRWCLLLVRGEVAVDLAVDVTVDIVNGIIQRRKYAVGQVFILCLVILTGVLSRAG